MAAVEQNNDGGPISELAPAASREELILTAVKFLQNPKVSASPYAQRKSFLLGKGLTDAEVEEALRRSGTSKEQPLQSSTTPGNSSVAINMPMTAVVPASSVSIWVKIRDFLNAGILISGLIYGLYIFYKKYILRWIFGTSFKTSSSTNSKVTVMEELRSSVTNVKTSVTELKEIVSRTNEQLDLLTKSAALNKNATEPSGLNVSEIKDEIRSLKSLLLSKNQFPPVPSGAPVLPAWQRQIASTKPITTSATVVASSKDDVSITASGGTTNATSPVVFAPEVTSNGLVNLAVTSIQSSASAAPANLSRMDNAIFPDAGSEMSSIEEVRVYKGLNDIICDELNSETLNTGLNGLISEEVNEECIKSTDGDGSLSMGLGEISLVELPESCEQQNGLPTDHHGNGSMEDEHSYAKKEDVLSVEHIGEKLVGTQKRRVVVDDETSSP